MTGLLGRLLSRRIAEDERHRAFLIVAAVLIAAAVGLSLARERQHAQRRATPTTVPAVTTQPTVSVPAPAAPAPAPAAGIPTPDGGRLTGSAPAAAMAAGRAFLTSYLRFSYGQAPPRFPDATRALAAQLARFHVDVGPELKSRRLSLLQLRAQRRNGGFEVGALASDGSSTFPIAAIVRGVHGRWLAVRVVTAAGGP